MTIATLGWDRPFFDNVIDIVDSNLLDRVHGLNMTSLIWLLTEYVRRYTIQPKKISIQTSRY